MIEPEIPEQAMKVAADWAGVSELFLISRVVDNPERTGFTALYEMTKRALTAEAKVAEQAATIDQLHQRIDQLTMRAQQVDRQHAHPGSR